MKKTKETSLRELEKLGEMTLFEWKKLCREHYKMHPIEYTPLDIRYNGVTVAKQAVAPWDEDK